MTCRCPSPNCPVDHETIAERIEAVIAELCTLAAFVDWVRPEITSAADVRVSQLLAAKDAVGVQTIYLAVCERQARRAIEQEARFAGDGDLSAAAENVLRQWRRENKRFPPPRAGDGRQDAEGLPAAGSISPNTRIAA